MASSEAFPDRRIGGKVEGLAVAETSVEETEVSTPVIPVLPARFAELRAELVVAVRRVCPPWLAGEAEDFVQECLIRLMQRTERATDTLNVSPGYLRKVAYCAVVDEMRRRQRSVAQDAGFADAEALAVADGTVDLEASTSIGAAIAACLALQNPDRRRAVTLHLLGHSTSDTAKILGCGLKRAENLVYRGLTQLRECLTSKGIRP